MHSHSLIPHGQDHVDLGMCLQGSQSAGRHLALTQELRPWEQAWRSGVCGATHWLHHRGLKTNSLGLPFLPLRKRVSQPPVG